MVEQPEYVTIFALSAARAAREDGIIRTAAAPCRNGSHSMAPTAPAVRVETPGACPTRSSPAPTGEPFFHPAPAKYILQTTHRGNYRVLPTERMIAEINIFPLLSNIFFDIF